MVRALVLMAAPLVLAAWGTTGSWRAAVLVMSGLLVVGWFSRRAEGQLFRLFLVMTGVAAWMVGVWYLVRP